MKNKINKYCDGCMDSGVEDHNPATDHPELSSGYSAIKSKAI